MESKALEVALPKEITTSQLSRVEVLRTMSIHAPDLLEVAYDVLIDIPMVPVENAVLHVAENLPSIIKLRTMDSIHLATAIILKSTIEGIITYDKEIIKAATKLGFKVISPGMK